MKLYEISSEFKALESMLEDGEIDAETFEATIEGVAAAFNDKVRNCVAMLKNMAIEEAGIDGEIARLKSLKSASAKGQESLESYLVLNMIAAGKEKIDLGIFKASIRAATKQLPKEIDESKISSEFFTVIPESKQLDRRALLAAIKIKPIAGIELVDSKRSLTIK